MAVHRVIRPEQTREILASAKIRPTDNQLALIAARLDDIAVAFFTSRYFLIGSRGRPTGKIGKYARAQLFGDLVGVFVDAPGVTQLPGASWEWHKKENGYGGRFVNLARAYAKALADYIQAEIDAGRSQAWRTVMLDLRNIQNSPNAAREGMRSVLRPR